jgi:hypothetical protein
MDVVLFKIDFEKAYDKVKWSFLQQILRMRGFDQKWCDLVTNFVEGGSLKSMTTLVTTFRQKKRFALGDPLSPIFFNIIVDMLSILIARAKEDG